SGTAPTKIGANNRLPYDTGTILAVQPPPVDELLNGLAITYSDQQMILMARLETVIMEIELRYGES
ncbi:hypothetical protein L195_g030835, partial [Trifolium pratense]